MKVLIAFDDQLMPETLRTTLEASGDLEVVAEARAGFEVLPLVAQTDPDIVLLDLRMAGIDGLGCLNQIRMRHPRTKVVVISASADPEHIQSAFQLGAVSYVVVAPEAGDLSAEIRQAVRSTAYGTARSERGVESD
jgi:DNA-binding NarL/FixJ family response regulator